MPIFQLLVVIVVAISFVGCAPSGIKKAEEKIYWPMPPETPRFVYETSLRAAKDIKILSTEDKIKAALTGITSDKKQAFAKPYDVAAKGGKIVVTDTVTRLAVMFDVPRGKVYPFGKRSEGRLLKPMGVAMDNNKLIYVADVSDNLVKVFDPLGLYLRTLGEKGEFSRPVDVAVSPTGDRVYVLDSGGISSDKHQVTIFDADGNKLKIIGTRGTNIGEFNLPVSITVAPDGKVYVLDSGNFRVQIFDRDGAYINSWGKVGRSLGEFARPRGIAVDNEGMIYITDAAFRNFQIFTPTGELLMPIGGPGLDDKPGQFVLPAGIAIDETDRIYIVDQLLNKVEVIRRLTNDEVAKMNSKAVHPVASESTISNTLDGAKLPDKDNTAPQN